jgi:hypothetical protein
VSDRALDTAPAAGRGPAVLFAVAAAVLGVVIVAAWLGALGGLFYDRSERVSTPAQASSALDSTRAIDRNVKYLAGQTGPGARDFGGLLGSMSGREDAIAPLAASTGAVLRRVDGLRRGATGVLGTSRGIEAGLAALDGRAAAAASALSAVAARTRSVAASLTAMRSATAALAASARSIDTAAGTLAATQLPAARAQTGKLDSLLPAGVPPARKGP